ncbi:MAG: adenosylcobinamide-phosphate synthase CbiB [SAR324 cluster bacterium]|nr:adenosylcobinamide-phosphate synthase CbiB [SAR324 cluster bacterium]
MTIESLFPFFSEPSIILLVALILDRFLGDPVYPLHPVRLIGLLSIKIESKIRGLTTNDGLAGFTHFLTMALIAVVIPALLVEKLQNLHFLSGTLVELFLVFHLIAFGDLVKHAKAVFSAPDIVTMREKASWLVSRDLKQATEQDCARATIESLAENLVDGFFTPLISYLFFGLEGLLFFKMVSTLDSMIGYKNEKYINFGFWAAKADDALNFFPARIFALILGLSALITPGTSAKMALKVALKDHTKHASPNSGWPESAVAGALGISLGGPVTRFGKLSEEPWIGKGLEIDLNARHQLILIRLSNGFWLVCFLFVALAGLLIMS